MEDDFQRMWDRVHHQVGILALQLTVLQRSAHNSFLDIVAGLNFR